MARYSGVSRMLPRAGGASRAASRASPRAIEASASGQSYSANLINVQVHVLFHNCHVVQKAEKRARALSAQKSEMAQARADIQHERERLAEEEGLCTRSSHEECDHKVDLER